jgi:predicted glycosyltransferase involved in capsule biosynthesis
MKTPYTFSFIISYKHNNERLHNLRRVLDWVNGFDKVEIILVEQDKCSKISHLYLKCKHIFTKSELPFNKSWGYNVGLNHSNTNVIVFGDSDIIMKPNEFITGLQSLENFEMVSPYSSVVDLNPMENILPFEHILKIDRFSRGDFDNQKINLCGGITMFRKDSILKIGGWDQRFFGWGCEDDFQTIKVKTLLTWTELKGKCFHFHHSKEPINEKLYKRSFQILEETSKLSTSDLMMIINRSRNTMGIKNLYDK